MDCLFCKIIRNDIPANVIYEDDELMAFYDIRPQAPKHILIIPKKHISTIDDVSKVDTLLLGSMIHCAKTVAHDEGLSEQGYRLVFNVNSGGGQEVYHIHLHLLGGRQMTWPPG